MAQITKAGMVLLVTVALTGLGSAAWYLIKDHKTEVASSASATAPTGDNPAVGSKFGGGTPVAGPVATQGLVAIATP